MTSNLWVTVPILFIAVVVVAWIVSRSYVRGNCSAIHEAVNRRLAAGDAKFDAVYESIKDIAKEVGECKGGIETLLSLQNRK